jgi:hypothetical protein
MQRNGGFSQQWQADSEKSEKSDQFRLIWFKQLLFDMKDAFEEYKTAILARYEKAKSEKNSHYLLDPTPANLKKLAAEICEEMSNRDAEVFKIFFGYELESKNKTRVVLNSETDKFRTISKFLNGKSNLQEVLRADLLAVLIDFEKRPFSKFRIVDAENEKKGSASNKISNVAKNKEVEVGNYTSFSTRRFLSKPLIVGCFALFLTVSGFALYKNFEKNCMVWKDGHYEKIDCETVQQGFAAYNPIFPLDDRLLENFKQIEVSDTTKFFDNGRPIVWYLKYNNKCDFFNSPGFHPISKKTLKEISHHIIKVHVLSK